jgi:hypothetical protein
VWEQRRSLPRRCNVGIGTRSPVEKLDVEGNIKSSGDISATRDITANRNLRVGGDIRVEGDIRLAGADCAEHFDVDDAAMLESGTVMVIADEERLCRCSEPYDKRVAGVLSGAGKCRPGLLLGQQSSDANRLPLALAGTVYCLVDAGHGAIAVGDLLTTSPTPGHAMKAADPRRAFGAVLGKALRPLRGGTALIAILVSLQ